MRKIFITLILIQLSLIGYLIVKINNQTSPKVLGSKTSISVIDKNSINLEPSSNLKYFYEPNTNATTSAKPTWLPKAAAYTINKDTLNERFDYSIDKPSNVFRIVTLGDSFTYGVNINTKGNWTEILEDKLNQESKCNKFNKFEVVNLGVGGYDIQYAVERYKIRGQKYNPDLIIWMLVDNRRILELIKLNLDQCEKENPKIIVNEHGFYTCWGRIKDQYETKFGKEKVRAMLTNYLGEIFKYYQKNILAVNLDNKHFKIIEPYPQIKNFPLDFFGKYKEYVFDDGHPNEKGHQYFADKIFEYIKNEKLIPCD